MRKDLNENFRDLNEENKKREGSKITFFDIVIRLLIGACFYFAYYVLMTDYFKVEAFKFPYLIISIYFLVATILFPYVSKRVNVWIEGNRATGFFVTSKIAMPFTYILTPIIFIVDFF